MPADSPNWPRAVAAVFACVVWFALGLQLYLIIGVAPGLGLGTGETIVRFASYFTIQNNLIVAVVTSAYALSPSGALSGERLRAGACVYIAVVGAVYVAVLRTMWSPQGAQALADGLLHYVAPLGYVAFWVLAMPKASLRYSDVVSWLLYPAAYVAVVVSVATLWTGFYPYPFIDLPTIGLVRFAANVAGLVVVFAATGMAVVAVARFIGTPLLRRY